MPIRSVAHRGYSARWPENTVAGARAAIAAGADLVEADVRPSADGGLYCFHDPDLRRLAGRDVAVADCRSEELEALRLDGEPPARLGQIVAAVAGRAGLLIDVKPAGPGILDALAAELAAAGWPADVWLGLRDPGQVQAAKALCRGRVGILALLPRIADADAFLSAGADALRLWEAEIALPEARRLRDLAPVWVTAGKTRGLKVGDTDAEGLRAIRAFGPTAVLLNDPTLLAGDGGA